MDPRTDVGGDHNDLWTEESDEDGDEDTDDDADYSSDAESSDSADGFLVWLEDFESLNSCFSVDVAPPSDSQISRLGNLIDDIHASDTMTGQQQSAMISLVKKHEQVFVTSYEHLRQTNLLSLTINTGEAAPIHRKPHTNLSYKEMEYLKTELQSMVDHDILVPSTYGPGSGWSFPVRFVPKKNGDKRLVTQFMALNAVTVRDHFPLPLIQALMDSLSGTSLFSSLDLLKGFHQVKMGEGSVDKLTITTPFGNYSYRVMPFGICNGPAVFSKMIAMALAPLRDCALAYIDDMVVFSDGYDNQLAALGRVFERQTACELVLNSNKCTLATSSFEFLEFTVDAATGISPRKQLVSCICSFPTPTCPKDVRGFLGLAGFFRQHVPMFADIALPLSNLLIKNVKFEWDDRCRRAMDGLCQSLVNAASLMFPNPDLLFELYTDASDAAIGTACEWYKAQGFWYSL